MLFNNTASLKKSVVMVPLDAFYKIALKIKKAPAIELQEPF